MPHPRLSELQLLPNILNVANQIRRCTSHTFTPATSPPHTPSHTISRTNLRFPEPRPLAAYLRAIGIGPTVANYLWNAYLKAVLELRETSQSTFDCTLESLEALAIPCDGPWGLLDNYQSTYLIQHRRIIHSWADHIISWCFQWLGRPEHTPMFPLFKPLAQTSIPCRSDKVGCISSPFPLYRHSTISQELAVGNRTKASLVEPVHPTSDPFAKISPAYGFPTCFPLPAEVISVWSESSKQAPRIRLDPVVHDTVHPPFDDIRTLSCLFSEIAVQDQSDVDDRTQDSVMVPPCSLQPLRAYHATARVQPTMKNEPLSPVLSYVTIDEATSPSRVSSIPAANLRECSFTTSALPHRRRIAPLPTRPTARRSPNPHVVPEFPSSPISNASKDPEFAPPDDLRKCLPNTESTVARETLSTVSVPSALFSITPRRSSPFVRSSPAKGSPQTAKFSAPNDGNAERTTPASPCRIPASAAWELSTLGQTMIKSAAPTTAFNGVRPSLVLSIPSMSNPSRRRKQAPLPRRSRSPYTTPERGFSSGESYSNCSSPLSTPRSSVSRTPSLASLSSCTDSPSPSSPELETPPFTPQRCLLPLPPSHPVHGSKISSISVETAPDLAMPEDYFVSGSQFLSEEGPLSFGPFF
ncbi:hypothetical protein BV25DRAFT_1818512 [Artomyces pyxidatus]|uniref:Uncharacterized protein n=1 Tax=Artomyces pyxidatus TaxID=48021 RepID=A0ACB8TI83_9AGAM|nr:hypothetical protein BV25DRAFT_1818512 [Artomyces pyxidatus]